MEYTNTYYVLTTLVNLLVIFLDFAMSSYLAKIKSEWIGFVFTFLLTIVNVYFIMIAKSHNKAVSTAKKSSPPEPVHVKVNESELKEELMPEKEEIKDEEEWSDHDDSDDEQNPFQRKLEAGS